ncbi:hypothetical protein RQN9TF_33135 (plasmid) [Rhodococcus qingshengii]|uniref:hypothetical protein n=1 Tax=Rhodococcus TaxID=1827 RepID=UPI000A5DECE0|nr:MULTISPECIES: hypothetical protein [Rhodococcus]MCZ4618391.1 hypothetical protein [Rhodococcus qingshengii]BDQ24108.1 hypothetical protein RQN9TF_33135 [Rhodococcus qingshengii]
MIANLAFYFAVHTLFVDSSIVVWGPLHLTVPDVSSFRPLALVIGALAVVMIYRLKWSVLRTLGVCALLGLAAGLVGLPVT